MKRRKVLITVLLVLLVSSCGNDDENRKEEENTDDTSVDTIKGTWQGSIKIPRQDLPIIISFKVGKNLGGTISIPVQGVEDFPLSKVTMNKSNVLFQANIQGQHITFDGSIKDDTIQGTFTQNGQSFPFELKKGKDKGSQMEEDQGQFLSLETDQGTLYAELVTPKGNAPYPVMIIIPGSGPTDRNGNSKALPGKNNSLKFLAQQLAQHGIASIRYDKRGVGKNLPALIPEEKLIFNRFVNDAVGWAEKLKHDQRFSKVGIIGHSQGSLVGMLAAQETNVDAFISLEGAGKAINQVMYNQLKEQLPDNLLDESKDILEKLQAGKRVQHINPNLQSIFRPSVQSFLSSWMQYDPAKEIQKLNIPVLIVNGKHDIQVPVSAAKNLYKEKGKSQLLLIPRMNHVLKEAPKDRQKNMQAYSDPDLPLANGLIEGILEFLENHGIK
ncbi:alpha/beta hydrolase family protein [Virgibacillus siamensis]|uniref:alpha/beta hydrolase family protein n=1 Tax=Virgibacillus siamensis TaxID=480071 RepID=UPI000984F450|nr:alpha/beta fold hydrolase [Virgibacillus siamensis]